MNGPTRTRHVAGSQSSSNIELGTNFADRLALRHTMTGGELLDEPVMSENKLARGSKPTFQVCMMVLVYFLPITFVYSISLSVVQSPRLVMCLQCVLRVKGSTERE